MFKFCKYFLLVSFFYCIVEVKSETKSETKSAKELLEEAKRVKVFDYEEAINLLEFAMLEYPNDEISDELMLEKAAILFKEQQFAEAAAVLDSFIEFYIDSKHLTDAKKMLFFCFYSALNAPDRNIGVIYKAFQQGEVLKKLLPDDQEIAFAHNQLTAFIEYEKLQLLHYAIGFSPKKWIQVFYASAYIIKHYPRSKYAQEAYFRLIELLVNQDDENVKKYAVMLFEQMKEFHKDSDWFQEAEILIKTKA